MDQEKYAKAELDRGDALAKKWTRPTVSRVAAGSAELGGDTLPEGVPITS
jgi:hypothetical protein